MPRNMKAIYEPKGAAREYAPLACNLYRGCVHGCKYCYVPGVLRMSKAEFHAESRTRPGILEALERDAKQLEGDPRPVFLCFTCAPWQHNAASPIEQELLLASAYLL